MREDHRELRRHPPIAPPPRPDTIKTTRNIRKGRLNRLQALRAAEIPPCRSGSVLRWPVALPCRGSVLWAVALLCRGRRLRGGVCWQLATAGARASDRVLAIGRQPICCVTAFIVS